MPMRVRPPTAAPTPMPDGGALRKDGEMKAGSQASSRGTVEDVSSRGRESMNSQQRSFETCYNYSVGRHGRQAAHCASLWTMLAGIQDAEYCVLVGLNSKRVLCSFQCHPAAGWPIRWSQGTLELTSHQAVLHEAADL